MSGFRATTNTQGTHVKWRRTYQRPSPPIEQPPTSSTHTTMQKEHTELLTKAIEGLAGSIEGLNLLLTQLLQDLLEDVSESESLRDDEDENNL